MMALFNLALLLPFLFFEISEECALPYWWNQQYNFQPLYAQSGQPKTTFRYRETIRRTDPNNYFYMKEYSEYTWWEQSPPKINEPTNQVLPQDVRHMTNIAFGKDASTQNFGFQPKLGFDRQDGPNYFFQGKTNYLNPHSKTNNIVPRGDTRGSMLPKDTNGMVVPTDGFMPKIDTNVMVVPTDVFKPKIDADGMVVPTDVFKPKIDTDGMVAPTDDFMPKIDTNGMVPFTDSIETVSTVDPNRVGLDKDSNDIETTVDLPRITTTEDNAPLPSPTAPEVEFDSSERERNENEDIELSRVRESDESENDLDTSSANRASSETKEAIHRNTFLSGWFGTKKENETGPCKVSETDIYSLRSMIENMFSTPREHLINPESKEKVREDILNKFRNFGLQVWTQNFTTPSMPNANGTEETNEGVNLIGVIPGSQRGRLEDEIVLLGAHYDTVPDSNGVDDNGSGLAVMLEVARAITEARCRLNHTLMFVAFDHEENGAMGSNYFVDHYLIPEELKRARARFQGAFILDGILNFNDVPNTQELPLDYTESLPGLQYFINNTGNRGDFLAMISRNQMDNHLSKKMMDAWKEQGDNKYKLFNLQVNMGNSIPEPSVIEKHLNFLTSDHATFWYHNSSSHFPESLNAVLLTDTGPFRGQMKKCYHSKCDDLTVISPEKLQFAKKTADALTATLVELTSAVGAGNSINLSWSLGVTYAITLIFASMFLHKV